MGWEKWGDSGQSVQIFSYKIKLQGLMYSMVIMASTIYMYHAYYIYVYICIIHMYDIYVIYTYIRIHITYISYV